MKSWLSFILESGAFFVLTPATVFAGNGISAR